jgi:hypothetical protein
LQAGAAAESASRKKVLKYSDISSTHSFIPIAIESLGPVNEDAITFLSALGKRLSEVSGDPREAFFLFQRLSITNQRLNAVAIRGCLPLHAGEDDEDDG